MRIIVYLNKLKCYVEIISFCNVTETRLRIANPCIHQGVHVDVKMSSLISHSTKALGTTFSYSKVDMVTLL